MPPPNTYFLPENARPMMNAVFLEVLLAMRDQIGIIDFIPDMDTGGDYHRLPIHGRFSGGFERADVTGTLTDPLTARTQTGLVQIAPLLNRALLHEWYASTQIRAGLSDAQFSAQIGENIAKEAAITLWRDIFEVALAAFAAVSGDHDHSVYTDGTGTADVDISPTNIQAAAFLMGDLASQMDTGVMHSKQFNDLGVDALSSARLVAGIMDDVFRNGMFRKVLGLDWIVDDANTSRTVTAGARPKYAALLLRSRRNHPQNLAPIWVSFQQSLTIYDQHVVGEQSVRFQKQPQMSYSIGVRGMTWLEAAGTNPTDTILNDPTNWSDAYSSHKEVGGVALQTN